MGVRSIGRVARAAAVVITLGALCSCKSELYEHLDERDANEMLAALYSGGVQAGKSTTDDKTWQILVETRDMPKALGIVTEHGLPHERFASVGEIFKKEGLVSTPSEERMRYVYAVSQELSNTLSQIDGVLVARVHPVIPANDPLATQIRPASASVFIKYRRDADLRAQAPLIKDLVMRSIEGLQYENISLTFVVAEELPHATTAPAWISEGRSVKAAFGGFGLLLAMGLIYGWNRKTAGRGTSGAAGVDSFGKRLWPSRVR